MKLKILIFLGILSFISYKTYKIENNSKTIIIQELNKAEIILKDDFKIIKSKMSEFYKEFVLIISNDDMKRI